MADNLQPLGTTPEIEIEVNGVTHHIEEADEDTIYKIQVAGEQDWSDSDSGSRWGSDADYSTTTHYEVNVESGEEVSVSASYTHGGYGAWDGGGSMRAYYDGIDKSEDRSFGDSIQDYTSEGETWNISENATASSDTSIHLYTENDGDAGPSVEWEISITITQDVDIEVESVTSSPR